MTIASRLCGIVSRLSIRSQVLALLVVSQILAHGVTILLVSGVLVDEGRKDRLRVDLSDAFISVLATLDRGALGPQISRLQSLAEIDERFVLLDVRPADATQLAPETQVLRAEVPTLWQDAVFAVAQPKAVRWPGPRIRPFAIVAELAEDRYLSFSPSPDILARTIPRVAATLAILFVGIPLAVFTFWAGSALVTPVARLSAGAERFAMDARAEDLDETGPREVRGAIRAFNGMQRKLRSMIDDRAHTLAAIGHDMRTPLTRLKLRLESSDLGEAEEGARRDMAQLEIMIDDALEFLRSESKAVDLGPVNLTSLVETAVNDMVDQGHNVTFVCQTKIDVICDITLTLRSMNNVLENALRYAGAALVAIRFNPENHWVEIVVTDTGPGIPEELMSIVTKPFSRLAAIEAGSEDTNRGFGLGLAIASECMERQGGGLNLLPNEPTGLVAILRLPLRPHA